MPIPDNEVDPPHRNRRGNAARAILTLGAVAGGAALARKDGVGPVLSGFEAGMQSLEESNDRARHRRLEDVMMQRNEEDRQDRRKDRDIETAIRDSRLRGAGYIPNAEAGSDPSVKVAGKTLDGLVNATVSGPGYFSGAPDVQTPHRYGTEVGGYRFDQLSPSARTDRAKAEKAERDARAPLKTAAKNYLRVQGNDGQWYAVNRSNPDDVHLLDDEHGVPIRGRLPVSSGGNRNGIPAESADARDNRRAADRDRLALNSTTREIGALRKEVGKYPSAADSSSGRVKRLDALTTRRDSIQGEWDRHSAGATAAALGGGRRADASSTPLQRELVQARQAYDATLAQGADSASSRALYERIVQAIRAKHRAP